MEKPASSALSFKQIATLLTLSLGLAIIVIDSTVLNVSIRNLIVDLKTNIQSIQWVISIYSLVLAALTITGGRLGDLWGRKRVFLLGAIIFAIGSLIASFSTNIVGLLLGWSVIEGIGAAMMMPATSALLISNFEGRQRALAFGIWGGVAAASSAVGPILGGFITSHYSWHWAFRINVLVVAILILCSTVIKESRDTKEKPQLDLLGAVLSSIGMFLIIFGIIQSSTYGWITAKQIFTIGTFALNFGNLSIVPISIAIGIFVLILFGVWQNYIESKGRTPLVSLKIFQNRQFTLGALTMSILALGQTGIVFAVPIFLQSVRGLDAFKTGMALLPLSIALLFAAPTSAYIAKKIQPKIILLFGLLVNVIAILVLRQSIETDTVASDLIPGLVLYGAGMGLVMAQINNITLSAVQKYQAGEASGVNATMRQVGSTLGSAIIGAVFLSAFTASLVSGVNENSVINQNVKTTILTALNSSGSNIEFGGLQSLGIDNLDENSKSEITQLSNTATVKGNKDALLLTAMLSVFGMGLAMLLPKMDLGGKVEKTMASEH